MNAKVSAPFKEFGKSAHQNQFEKEAQPFVWQLQLERHYTYF